MAPICKCTGGWPNIGPKGCTFDGLPKKPRKGKKPGPKPGSHNPKKRKYVTSVVIPSKRTKTAAEIRTVLGKRKGSVADANAGIFTRLRKRLRA